MGGWMTDGWVGESVHGCVGGWMDDGWIDGWMDG